MDAIKQMPQVDPVEFALALHRRFAKGDEPVLLSPVSISLALRPLMLGARGETAAGIARVLAGGPERGDGPTADHSDPDRALKPDGRTLSLAIGLWLDQQMRVEPSFADVMKADPRVEWFDMNFAASDAAILRINAWTKERTKGRIRDLLAPGSIDPLTRLVSTSALHFQAEWRKPFEKYATTPLPFTCANGAEIRMPMMISMMKTRFARAEEARMLELEYRNGYVFQALLPDSPSGLERLEAHLTPAALNRWTDSLKSCEVYIVLPKFQREAEYDLRTGLMALGMESAFEPGRADFSGIGRSPDGLPLFVSKAVHKTFIDVNELETEAAAATAWHSMVMGGSAHRFATEQFLAHHPFLYLIRNGAKGSILFIGRMTGR